jgi:hypothetical protein
MKERTHSILRIPLSARLMSFTMLKYESPFGMNCRGPDGAAKTKNAVFRRRSRLLFAQLHLSLTVGLGTLFRNRLPWLHRAVPSATLDGTVYFAFSRRFPALSQA